jgi:hypothetical protein
MPLFSRRSLQDLLIRNSDVLTPEQQKRLAKHLNSTTPQECLAAQWELVFLDVFHKIGEITYEPTLKGTSRPDFLVKRNSPTNPGFIVDVTAISDKHIRELNPLDEFEEEFWRLLRKAGLPVRGYDLQIGSKMIEIGKSQHVVLAIPKRPEFPDFFDAKFKRFLAAIKERPEEIHGFERRDASFDVEIKYSPDLDHLTGGYGGFDGDLWPEKTSTYKALVKKYRQIKNSDFEGPAGIVICDAGAPVFRQNNFYHQLTMKKLAENFLKAYPRVSFVVSAAAVPRHSLIEVTTNLEIGVYINESSYYPCDDELSVALRGIAPLIPKLQTDARHAKRVLEVYHGRQWLSYMGTPISWHRKDGMEIVKIRLSARALLDLLGGQQSLETFLINNFLKRAESDPNAQNPFSDAIRRGDRLVDIRLLRSNEDDDDWIEFEFRGKDAAIAGIQAEIQDKEAK